MQDQIKAWLSTPSPVLSARLLAFAGLALASVQPPAPIQTPAAPYPAGLEGNSSPGMW